MLSMQKETTELFRTTIMVFYLVSVVFIYVGRIISMEIVC